jgi:hypothetical protein
VAAFAIETSFFMGEQRRYRQDAATHKRFSQRLTMPHLTKSLKNERILQAKGRKWLIHGGLCEAVRGEWQSLSAFVGFLATILGDSWRGRGAIGGHADRSVTLDFNSAQSYRTEPEPGRLRTGIAGA